MRCFHLRPVSKHKKKVLERRSLYALVDSKLGPVAALPPTGQSLVQRDLLSISPRAMQVGVFFHGGEPVIAQQPSKRIPPVQQVNPLAVGRRQAPLGRFKERPRRRAVAGEAHRGPAPGPLNGEVYVDPALHLVHLAPDPGDLVLEVDVVAEDGAGAGVGAQGVQRRGHNGRRRLLVVEDGDGADGHDGEEDGEGAAPAEADLADFCGLVSILHRRAGETGREKGGGGSWCGSTWELAVCSAGHERSVTGFRSRRYPSSLDGPAAGGRGGRRLAVAQGGGEPALD